MTGDRLPVRREAETNELGAFLDELAVTAASCLLEGEAGPAVSLPLAARARWLCQAATTGIMRRADSVWGFAALLAGDGTEFQACTSAAGPVLDETPADFPARETIGDVISSSAGQRPLANG